VVSGIYKMIDSSLIHQLRFETLSNNLANINTYGFRKDILSFDKQLAAVVSTTDFSPGDLRHTGNQFDVALGSQGFFKIQTPKGIRYTRDGAFTLNKDGTLVTQSGDSVLGQNGPITINGQEISIKRDGQIIVDQNPVDQLSVVDFKQPRFLKKEGASRYVYQGEDQWIAPAETVDVQHKYIESSNVNATEEMIQMIESMRAFESSQKAIQAIDQINSKMVNDLGIIQ